MKKKAKHIRWLLVAIFGCLSAQAFAEEPALPKRELASFKNPSPCKPSIKPSDNRLSGSTIANALGWVKTDDPSNLCKGYFTEPVVLNENPRPGAPDTLPTTITASGASKFIANGESIIEGNVVLTQPGRVVKADKAYVYRNGETGHITVVELFQHVSLEEHGKRILGSHALLNLEDNTWLIDDVLYHIYRVQKKSGDINSWGEARLVKQEASGLLDLEEASFSNASPVNPAWKIKARKLVLNREEGWGKAYHATLKFFKTPVFYFPYYSFPIDNRRKTGVLQPTMGYSKENGADFSLPVYFNLAPNYDWMLTPRLMTERGVQFNNLFRYLTPKTDGSIYLSYLPNDQGFQSFKNEVLGLYPDNSTYQTYLNQLNDDSNNRGFISMKQTTVFNEEWKSNLNINYVTDAYYFQDFGSSGGFGSNGAGNVLSNQLLNQYDIKYTGEHWVFTSLVQAYETLHPINQPTNNDQYRRLPEFDLNGNYPELWKGLGVSLESQAVNFGYQSDFTPDQPIGQRAHVRPGINLPINWAAAYVIPEVQWDTTAYAVQQAAASQANTTVRNIPMVNIDSGIYLDRQFKWASHQYTQTFEPEFFYLYVPFQNQNQIPVFDTQLQPFTINQLFATNAFTGFDRIQNANQVSLGLSSRFLDRETGEQKLSASMGVINYFQRPQVCLTSSCTPTSENFSPIVGQLSYNPSSHWTATVNMAWDPNIKQTNNSSLGLNYNAGQNRTATLNYQFVRGTPGVANSDQVQTGGSWPLAYHWSTLAYLNYNLTQHYAQNVYAGLEYDSCGWALRLISSRNFTGTLPTGNQYDTVYYVQLQLTGLGSLGTHKSQGLLSTLPGYQNTFN